MQTGLRDRAAERNCGIQTGPKVSTALHLVIFVNMPALQSQLRFRLISLQIPHVDLTRVYGAHPVTCFFHMPVFFF